MDLRQLTDKHKKDYNQLVNHLMQSWEWGEFRQQMGVKLLRYGIFEKGKMVSAFQLSFHQIPFTSATIGYLAKGPFPDEMHAQALAIIGKENGAAMIKVEPNVVVGDQGVISSKFVVSPKSLFTKFDFLLDLSHSEEELLAKMHSKTRYNIRLAQKKGVKVEERGDDQAFDEYYQIFVETTKRQRYFGHNQTYHKTVWEILKKAKMGKILIAYYHKKPLSAWMLVNFKDTLYYPYGGSLNEDRNIMHSNAVCWAAIKYGQKLKLKQFDMWGALGPNADPNDSWWGFHHFKAGYGPRLVEYIGTYDLVFNYPIYFAFNLIDKNIKLKANLLKLLRR